MDLIQKYGSIDTLYGKLPDIEAKPAAIRKLTEGEDAARRSYWLATIVTDAPLAFDLEENRIQPPSPEAYPLFLRLEFSKLIEKLGLRPTETDKAPAGGSPGPHRPLRAGHRGEAGPGGPGPLPAGAARLSPGPAGPLRPHGGLRRGGGGDPFR